MRTALCASLCVLMLLFAVPVDAQQPKASSAPKWHPNAAQAAALADGNVAALKAALNLTPDQAKNWPPVEAAIHDLAQKRSARYTGKQAERTAEAHFDRIKQRAATLTQIAAGLNEWADAATPLFQSLNSSQRQLFIVLTKWVKP